MKAAITGGTGFLGRHLAHELAARKWEHAAWGRKDADLERYPETLRLFQAHKPEIVFHLAALVGGIGANQKRPAEFWRANMLMGINVLDACLAAGVKRLVMVGTTCSYPKHADIPFMEANIFDGYPEETNAPYGIAKRALMVAADAYARQFGLGAVVAVLTNLYGPGDKSDPGTSHVIPALMRKIHEAKREKKAAVEVWGTGNPTRDFLYVADAARGLADLAERAPNRAVVNLGSGAETTIAGLAGGIAEVARYTGKILFDASKPDGQPRRLLDCAKAEKLLGWKPRIALRDGLRSTYAWYAAQAQEAAGAR